MITRALAADVARALGAIESERRRCVATDGWTGTASVLDTCRDTGRVTVEVRGRTAAGQLVHATLHAHLTPRDRNRSQLVATGDLDDLAAVVDALVGPPARRRPERAAVAVVAVVGGVAGAAALALAMRARRWRR